MSFLLPAKVLSEAAPLRRTEADDARGLSQFLSEVVQLAVVLNGDHFLSSFPDEMGKEISMKEAHTYVKGLEPDQASEPTIVALHKPRH
ncbi:hypothetical protein E3N88_21174 [Mikania micrantha]|uniref:Uncharacterized protein n=1 Tax=Mikania micrantha TaxID=192012 RepID=A0A5N6NJ37_9ASTR|nr:hypothetical protein E3N88_21174 [Mikania micrantha]